MEEKLWMKAAEFRELHWDHYKTSKESYIWYPNSVKEKLTHIFSIFDGENIECVSNWQEVEEGGTQFL